MKKFTEGSYCDVRGWDEELISKTADIMAEDLGTVVWDDDIALHTYPDTYLLSPSISNNFEVAVYGVGVLHTQKAQVTKEEVEQMIKEREQGGTVINPENTIDKLSQAADRLIQAEKEYYEVLAQAQQEYAGKFEIKPLLKLVAAEISPLHSGVDTDDPTTWEEGDIIECIDNRNSAYLTKGREYKYSGLDEDGEVIVQSDDQGDSWSTSYARFHFVRRPQ